MVFRSVPDTAAEIAVPLPFKIPVIDVVRVRVGVAPPEDEPVKPLEEATDTEVTVPCGCAVQENEPPVQVKAFVPVQEESPKPLMSCP